MKTLLYNVKEMIGKTVVKITPEDFSYDDTLCIHFDDNTCIVLDSEHDYDEITTLEVKSEHDFSKSISGYDEMRKLELITEAEYVELSAPILKENRENQLARERQQYEELKKKFGES
jgi:hypothetical protein